MTGEEAQTTDAKRMRVTITLNNDVYEDIKKISRSMGIRPSTWISMTATTNVKGMRLRMESNGNSEHDNEDI